MAEPNSGDSEQNVYSDDVREEYVESDEISPEEEAFMRGYEEADEEEEDKEDKEKKEEQEEGVE